MGILDDLKQKAEAARVTQESEGQRLARLEEGYQQRLRPKMQLILRYLHEMAEQLQVVKLEIPVIYTIPQLGPEQFYQQLFRIHVDHNDKIKKISLQMDCVAAESATYPVKSTAAADEVRTFLDKQGVKYTEWAIRDANNRVCGANFEGRLQVKVRMLLQVNIEKECIEVLSVNFEGLSSKRMTFSSTRIDDQWLDELGHYLLRKETKLGSLEITDDHKEFIRTQLISWEEQRQRELEETANSRNEEGKQGDDLLASLRKTLNKPLW